MNKPTIAGIQQIGIGVPDVKKAFQWYASNFGMDIPIFEEAAEANLMLPYTGGKPHQRHAILAINLKGGGGFEIWQYTSRVPQPPAFEIQLGDMGIFATRIKSVDVEASHHFLKSRHVTVTPLSKAPDGSLTFFLRDPWGNLFQIVRSASWFGKGMQLTGGIAGCMIGVSDMDVSKRFYASILGYDTTVYDTDIVFPDLSQIPGGEAPCRRVLLKHSKARKGAFSHLLGETEIELVQLLHSKPRKIFRDRFWGDLGFIHLCFDINNMESMKEICREKGHPFTVDSGSKFDMGEAAGHFAYIEDLDGTLIEFVETKRIPVLKKLNWYLDLRKRNPEKPLPHWMLKALKFNRVKFDF